MNRPNFGILKPERVGVDQLDTAFRIYSQAGVRFPPYCVPVGSYVVTESDFRLRQLALDNSPASIKLWNFLLSEEARLHRAHQDGFKLVACMKDLGTAPILAYASAHIRAFYPDGTWWTPCLMELSDALFAVADGCGVGPAFCPVRAMLGAFINGEHFPMPDLCICAVGAICDDFSAIAQRLEHMGQKVHWWELPRRRMPSRGEPAVPLPGGMVAPVAQVRFLRAQFEVMFDQLRRLVPGESLSAAALAASIRRANRVRRILRELRTLVFTAPLAPLPALEELIAEMLVIHFCSDPDECAAVLEAVLDEVRARVHTGVTPVPFANRGRLVIVNPVPDLRLLNLIEDIGLRVCGTDYMFTHALEEVPETLDPFDALARAALADPMIGPASERAARVVETVRRVQADAVIVIRIPGASHCAWEGAAIREHVMAHAQVPVLELEVPSVIDPVLGSLKTRLEALAETIQARRNGKYGK